MADKEYVRHLFGLADKTLEGLRRLELAPTAENYAVWLAYIAGRNPHLLKRIRELRAEQRTFDQALMDRLYEDFIARNGQELLEHSRQAGLLVNAILGDVGIVQQSTGNYGETLSRAVAVLTNIDSRDDVLGLTQELHGATLEMQEHTEQLRAELRGREAEIGKLRQALDEAHMASRTDPLTGIGNRGLFDERLAEAVEQAHMERQPLSLVLLDIDHFKSFNDRHGHQVGDVVIRLVATRLREMVKGRDLPARYGGEEFAVILPQTPCPGAAVLAEMIRKVLATSQVKLKSSEKALGTVTASFGISSLRAGDSVDDLIGRADRALYEAKHAGRNRVMTEEALAAEMA
ncbi:MAG: GGDEF domain-containing protein [Geminicoccaceae bacterium]|nr:GGDEF domain-containing protein [Geminicoccaceae bacterium]MCB9944151.1 GGDEF domain-containing protein [Geminicoccaceae bacterium]